MKPYNDLSDAGKLRRLRAAAAEAVSRYDLKNPEIAYHGFYTNLLYRVTTASGEQFMLRLASPGWRTFNDLQSEAMWLTALARDTAVPVPSMLTDRSGAFVLQVSQPGVPDTWNASLMRWMPGRQLGHYLSGHNLEKMGRLFADLHHHGAAWVPPAGFTTRRFENWLSRGEQNRITATASQPDSALEALHSSARGLLDRMNEHVVQSYAALDRTDLRVIHCDLWHDNIKLYQGVLHPLDFEDTIWGFRAHDIAMAMLDLMETVGDARYPDLLAAFRRGYETQMSWPDDRLEPFQIGRLLWKINWVANHQPKWLGSMVDRHVPVLEHYEQTGQIICPPGSQ